MKEVGASVGGPLELATPLLDGQLEAGRRGFTPRRQKRQSILTRARNEQSARSLRSAGGVNSLRRVAEWRPASLAGKEGNRKPSPLFKENKREGPMTRRCSGRWYWTD
jgi:hypothetical protein